MKIRSKFLAFLHREWLPLALMFALFATHLIVLSKLGIRYTLGSDDYSYVRSGITLAETGILTMHDESYPSAQIMPGLSVLIALVYKLFGAGDGFWTALKLLWACMGTLTGWFVYHSTTLFAPNWCAAVAVLPLFRPDFLWMDNLILTETPFTLLFTMLIYFTFQMGQTGHTRYYVGCGISYMLALMLKANIGLYPLFAGAYLLCKRYDWKKLIKQGIAMGLVLLCFLIPWTIRNYRHFDDFIPLTYGSGNPQLLGTYQGIGFPFDETLDYETNVNQIVRERYAKYYNEDGSIPERYQRYISLAADGIKARYRQEIWWQTHPGSLAISYLFLKPWIMMNDPFYWESLWGITYAQMRKVQYLDMILCVIVLFATFFTKRNRAELWYLTILYLGNVLLYCTTYAYGRYNIALLPTHFILIGIGLGTPSLFSM